MIIASMHHVVPLTLTMKLPSESSWAPSAPAGILYKDTAMTKKTKNRQLKTRIRPFFVYTTATTNYLIGAIIPKGWYYRRMKTHETALHTSVVWQCATITRPPFDPKCHDIVYNGGGQSDATKALIGSPTDRSWGWATIHLFVFRCVMARFKPPL